MIWQGEWKAISDRIVSLMNIRDGLVEVFKKNNEDPHGMSGCLSAQVKNTNESIRAFLNKQRPLLPANVNRVLEEYLQNEPKQNYIPGNSLQNTANLLFRASVLISEIDYHLADTSDLIKRQSERAFLHLQQSIVAAEDIRVRWQKAFDEGEVACEKLGAAHLLQHGIYAFKASAKGAHTDLVFGERTLNIADVERTADGLVLTEWKKVQTHAEASAKAENARKQAALYHAGILSGIELVNYRYIVLMSENQMDGVADVEENGIIYRHINIAVAPLSPSKAAFR